MDTPQSPNTPQQKKGLSGLAIAGIGCGGLALIACMVLFMLIGKACTFFGELKKNPAKATAMLAIKSNPNLEIVKTDDTKGTVTIHDKKTGDDVTMSFDDIAKGKFTMKTSKGEEINVDTTGAGGKGTMVIKNKEGTTVIGGGSAATELPAWVPGYPGAVATPGSMRMEKNDSVTGSHASETTDKPGKVKEFYEAKLKELGYETESVTMNFDGRDNASVSGKKDDGKRKVSVNAGSDGSKTQITVIYEGPKS